MAQRYTRANEQFTPPPEWNPYAPEPSLTEALSQAPLPTDPLARAARGVQSLEGMPGVVGGAPVGTADFTPSLPRSWGEAALDVGLIAAPVVGRAAWKARGVPRTTIDALKRGSGDPLMSKIAERDVVYHATSPEGLQGILQSGRIIPEGRDNAALATKLMEAGTKFEQLPEAMQLAEIGRAHV